MNHFNIWKFLFIEIQGKTFFTGLKESIYIVGLHVTGVRRHLIIQILELRLIKERFDHPEILRIIIV